jgi:hypothetical protein
MIKDACIIIIAAIGLSACVDSGAAEKNKKDLISNLQVSSDPSIVNKYSWQSSADIKNNIVNRIAVPVGFKRVEVKAGSFGDWLRHLPLKPGRPEVHLYNGQLKGDQKVHYAVVDIDVGNTDLQQCADAVMRMRAEYLYSTGNYPDLHFKFTSGNSIGFKKWSDGYKTVVNGNKVSWAAAPGNNASYKSFREYMNTIFTYAGTLSLSREMKKVADIKNIEIGDVFIVGGSPGHAVLVVDVCENAKTGERLFMIQQSYMPAQEIHILNNYNNSALSPWYSVNFTGDLETPQWTFSKDQLMRF